jgi:hypothetical protein
MEEIMGKKTIYKNKGVEIGTFSSEIEIKALPAPWVCPKCNKANAPWVNQCPCPVGKYEPYPFPYPFPYPRPPRPLWPWPMEPIRTVDWPPGYYDEHQTGDPLPDDVGTPIEDFNTSIANDKYDITVSITSPEIDITSIGNDVAAAMKGVLGR